MKITLQFEANDDKDSYWDDKKQLEQIIKFDDYRRLIFDFNEWLIHEIKKSIYIDRERMTIEHIQKQWIEFMNDRNINIDNMY